MAFILNKNIKIYGSGRTDAGVHALGQTFHFDVDKEIDSYKFLHGANELLPNDIVLIKMEKASDEAIIQAGRNMLLSFKDSLIGELDGLIQAEPGKAESKSVLETLVPETVKEWAKNTDASELSVLLSEKDLKALEASLTSELKAEIAKGLEIKADKSMTAGFRIGVNNGAAFYDYSAESLAEMFADPKENK